MSLNNLPQGPRSPGSYTCALTTTHPTSGLSDQSVQCDSPSVQDTSLQMLPQHSDGQAKRHQPASLAHPLLPSGFVLDYMWVFVYRHFHSPPACWPSCFSCLPDSKHPKAEMAPRLDQHSRQPAPHTLSHLRRQSVHYPGTHSGHQEEQQRWKS